MKILFNGNEIINVNNQIDIDYSNNTIDIIDVSKATVKGKIYINNQNVEYDLSVDVNVKIDDKNTHNIEEHNLIFDIQENCEIIEENSFINEKTLDLSAKVWENIVVEVFNISSSNEITVKSGDGWSLNQEVEEPIIDERLAPLLELLDSDEEV